MNNQEQKHNVILLKIILTKEKRGVMFRAEQRRKLFKIKLI